ncbi:MAG TPA: hypothetical protein VI895_02440 [Bdellovibrionota bacterium]|nr:hypothetical protein [Bdellovibrionota bacterium]
MPWLPESVRSPAHGNPDFWTYKEFLKRFLVQSEETNLDPDNPNILYVEWLKDRFRNQCLSTIWDRFFGSSREGSECGWWRSRAAAKLLTLDDDQALKTALDGNAFDPWFYRRFQRQLPTLLERFFRRMGWRHRDFPDIETADRADPGKVSRERKGFVFLPNQPDPPFKALRDWLDGDSQTTSGAPSKGRPIAPAIRNSVPPADGAGAPKGQGSGAAPDDSPPKEVNRKRPEKEPAVLELEVLFDALREIGREAGQFRSVHDIHLESQEQLVWKLRGLFRERRYAEILSELKWRRSVEHLRDRLTPGTQVLTDIHGKMIQFGDSSVLIRAADGSTFRAVLAPNGTPRLLLNDRDALTIKVRKIQELEQNGAALSEVDRSILRTEVILKEGFWIPFGQTRFPLKITDGNRSFIYRPPRNGHAGRIRRFRHRFRTPENADSRDIEIIRGFNQALQLLERRPVHYTEVFDPFFVQLLEHLGL